ncbi:TatD family hydrolase [Candidatus Dependentiae bacterium]|nr:TatD family hydrolase [Candidatus Dependentiae bacterium]
MFIDAHAHLDMYKGNRRKIISQIEENKIFTISNSMDIPSYQENMILSEFSEYIIPTFGIHPWNAPEYASDLNPLRNCIRSSKMIGEVGLDFHFVKDSSEYAAQKKIFEFFLQSAQDQQKIITIHTKGAEKEVLSLLKKYNLERVIIHWYSGPINIFRELISLGVFFTFGVEVLTSKEIQALAKELPSNLLLTETDNPGGYKWLRGKEGQPSILFEVIKKLAELNETEPYNIQRAAHTNFIRLIRNDHNLSEIYRFLLDDLID